MKFIVSSSLLQKQLQHINGLIKSNTVLPILENFLFEVDKNKLTVMATDLETVMKIQMDVEAREKGKVCVPAKILLDYLRNNPEQPLTFSIDNNYAIEITSDNGRYKVMGESPDNYPKEPQPEDTEKITMRSGDFLTGINKTIYAVSNDDLRPAMTGVFFEIKNDLFNMVATDAHRLVKFTLTNVKSTAEKTFIVPRTPLALLKSSLPDNDDEIELSYSDSHLFVKHDHTELACRLIDARFPDYKVVIPAENPFKMLINRASLQNALRRLSVFSNKSTYQVVLGISGNELQLNSQDIDLNFEGNERMACQYDGDDMRIAFNAKFMGEMLNSTDSEDVTIELSAPTKAGIIKPVEIEDGEELLMLVMPLMIQ